MPLKKFTNWFIKYKKQISKSKGKDSSSPMDIWDHWEELRHQFPEDTWDDLNDKIPRDVFHELKKRLRRKEAFKVSSKNRAAIRSARSTINQHCQPLLYIPFVLPISSTSWSSATFDFEHTKIAVVDTEQANAVEFLLSRDLSAERPLFLYVEYMIRAAEMLVSENEFGLALSITQRCEERLRMDATGDLSELYRPRRILDHRLVKCLEAKTVINFIVGHELGHIIQDDLVGMLHPLRKIFLTLVYSGNFDRSDGSSYPGEPPAASRFFRPAFEQRFSETGKYVSDEIMQPLEREEILLYNLSERQECEADVFGLLAATNKANKNGIEPEYLLKFLERMLFHTELLLQLRSIVHQIPRGAKSAYVEFKPSHFAARRSCIARMCELIGLQPTYNSFLAKYWRDSKFDHPFLDYSTEGVDPNLLGELISITARAGLTVGLQGNLNLPYGSRKELPNKFGEGTFNFLRQADPRLFQIETFPSSFTVTSETHCLYPFGAAIRDVTEVITTTQSQRSSMETFNSGSYREVIQRVRRPREWVVNQSCI